MRISSLPYESHRCVRNRGLVWVWSRSIDHLVTLTRVYHDRQYVVFDLWSIHQWYRDWFSKFDLFSFFFSSSIILEASLSLPLGSINHFMMKFRGRSCFSGICIITREIKEGNSCQNLSIIFWKEGQNFLLPVTAGSNVRRRFTVSRLRKNLVATRPSTLSFDIMLKSCSARSR